MSDVYYSTGTDKLGIEYTDCVSGEKMWDRRWTDYSDPIPSGVVMWVHDEAGIRPVFRRDRATDETRCT